MAIASRLLLFKLLASSFQSLSTNGNAASESLHTASLSWDTSSSTCPVQEYILPFKRAQSKSDITTTSLTSTEIVMTTVTVLISSSNNQAEDAASTHISFPGTLDPTKTPSIVHDATAHMPDRFNISFATSSPALFPINVWEVPYLVANGSTIHLNATVTTDRGLSFLLATYSSEGKVHTSNLGMILPEPTSTVSVTICSKSAPSRNVTQNAISDAESQQTSTILVNSTRTIKVVSTTTSRTQAPQPPPPQSLDLHQVLLSTKDAMQKISSSPSLWLNCVQSYKT